MTLVQLRYLVAIVDAGMNITAAAGNVNATQPGLSKQLKLLEAELGAPLFIRHGRTLTALSEIGVKIVESAHIILNEVTAIRTAGGSGRIAPMELRIATTHTQARLLLPIPLAALKSKYRDLSVHISPTGDLEAIKRIEEDLADVAIVSSVQRPSTDEIALALYRWNLVGLLPKSAPSAKRYDRPSLAELARTPLVTYDSVLEPNASLDLSFQAEGLKPQIAFTARDSDTIKTYVRAGLGFGILAEFAVSEEDENFTIIDLNGLFPPRITWAVFRRTEGISRQVSELLRAIAPRIDFARIPDAEDRSVVPHWRDMVFS